MRKRKTSTYFARFLSSASVCIFLLACCNPASADHLTLEISGKTVELDGEILIEAQDNSLFFRAVDGRLWLVKAEQIKSKTDVEEPVKALSKKEMGARLLKELPD